MGVNLGENSTSGICVGEIGKGVGVHGGLGVLVETKGMVNLVDVGVGVETLAGS